MPGYLPTLNGWRAVAIFAVVACHAAATLFAPGGGAYPSLTWYDRALRGEAGVDVFFGISGFLICSRLLDERRRTGQIDLRRFYVRRTFRIVPAALAYLGVLALVARLVTLEIDPREWWASLFYFRNYLPGAAGDGWFTGHFWSLAVEEHFYLLWPALLIAWAAADARRRTAALALAIAAWGVLEGRGHWLESVLPVPAPTHRTDVRLDGLLWGCWMALVLNEPARRDRMARWLSGYRGPAVVGLLLVVTVAKLPMGETSLAMLVPFALAATVLHPKTRLGAFLEWGPLQAVGKLSYSLYLWQQLFLLPPKLLPHPPLGLLQLWPWNVVAAFACAAISYWAVERPMIGLGHRLTTSKAPAPSGVVPGPHFAGARPRAADSADRA